MSDADCQECRRLDAAMLRERARATRAEQLADALADALIEAEWDAVDEDDRAMCVVCGGQRRHTGHRPNCVVGEALAQHAAARRGML